MYFQILKPSLATLVLNREHEDKANIASAARPPSLHSPLTNSFPHNQLHLLFFCHLDVLTAEKLILHKWPWGEVELVTLKWKSCSLY